MIDLLVAMSVIAVLISLMIPTLAAVRETTRKVVCSSNIRQLGLGMAMFADDEKGMLPYSRNYNKSLTDASFQPVDLMKTRITWGATREWDGLGLLFDRGYCRAQGVYYCPSCPTENRLENFTGGWMNGSQEVVINYQYRGGAGAVGQSNINRMIDRVGLISDGLASRRDFNHSVGANVVGSDLSVLWYDDSLHGASLPVAYTDPGAKDSVLAAWTAIDQQLFKK